jgi:hypothetical protein
VVCARDTLRRYDGRVSQQRESFWSRHPGLVWSNPDAGDEVKIRAALLRPRFLEILEIAHEFGVDRVTREWQLLSTEGTTEARRASPSVERILSNIARGAALAARRDQ